MAAVKMRIQKIDDALEQCESHLANTDTVQVERLLTQALLILICAEFEIKYRELVRQRFSSVEDPSIKEYLESRVKKEPRNLKVTGLTELLNRFGQSHGDEFKNRTTENNRAERMYSSIWSNRNLVAHGEGSPVTFRDIKQYYEEGHVVLDYFREALCLQEVDTVGVHV